MQKIKVLPDALASQVAAGEVVERPASVVKELVENSIDAGARRIDILVRQGGTALLKIVDDGSGMGREDAVLCLERHATSKLRTKEGLAAITTMGFRGEALPSIASVSRFTLTTREPGALSGTTVIVDGGRLVTVEDSGEAPGTHIEVRNLFYNVPARRKFLRSENTEFSHIEQQVRIHALAHPEIAFSLTRDERLLFHLPGGGGLRERIAGLAGMEVAEKLLEVPRTSLRGLTVTGFIGEAGTHRSSRAMMFTFLNRRPVESPVFNYALRGAYAEALPRGNWPVVFLFLEIDPHEVDVNVHPAKREVRFRDGLGVQSALMEILSAVIRRGRNLPAAEAAPVEGFTPAAPARALPPEPAVVPPVVQWRPAPRQPVLLPDEPAASPVPRDVEPPVTPVPELAVPAAEKEVPPAPIAAPDKTAAPLPFRILNPLGSRYWLMEGDEGLVILDHRAAWERILFEEARTCAAAGGVVSQQLLAPITVTFSPREYDFLRPHLHRLRLMGVGAADFGGNTLLIDSLPPFYTGDGDVAGLISALISDLQNAGDRAPQRRLSDDTIAAAVARQAARLRPPENASGAARLTARLLACEMPYCCPEGRPTLIQISFQELARKFGRR
jgi:DNA mismatch repair protein MutL